MKREENKEECCRLEQLALGLYESEHVTAWEPCPAAASDGIRLGRGRWAPALLLADDGEAANRLSWSGLAPAGAHARARGLLCRHGSARSPPRLSYLRPPTNSRHGGETSGDKRQAGAPGGRERPRYECETRGKKGDSGKIFCPQTHSPRRGT